MPYKIIDGIAYEVKEVNLETLKIEVGQSLALVEEQERKIEELNSAKVISCQQIETQIANYEKQIVAINTAIASLRSDKETKLAPIDSQIAECNNKIAHAKLALSEKKEVIESLMPEEAKKLSL